MTLMLVFSDTHGDLVVAEQAIARFPQAGTILHLGDYARDAVRLAVRHPELKVIGVAGNCDFDPDPERFPAERLLEVEGKRLLLVHGNRHGVKSGYDKLIHHAGKQRADLTLFGHTHISADFIKDGCHMLNPGSPSFPKGMGGPSFALVEIGHGLLETRLMAAED